MWNEVNLQDLCTQRYLFEWIMKHASSSYVVIKEFRMLNTQNRVHISESDIVFLCAQCFIARYFVARKRLAVQVDEKKTDYGHRNELKFFIRNNRGSPRLNISKSLSKSHFQTSALDACILNSIVSSPFLCDYFFSSFTLSCWTFVLMANDSFIANMHALQT